MKVNRRITEIIVHCTATPEGREVHVPEVNRWHRERGFDGIGYHYLIALDGTIEPGRDIERAGAHCLGHNAHSIGIAYVGGLDGKGKAKDTRTPAQRESLRLLIRFLKKVFPGTIVYGHRDFANKECPCFDAKHEFRIKSNLSGIKS
jgi:N-acetylmuramoyl-L-alanine amidase